MRATQTARPSPSGRSLRLRLAAGLLVAGVLPACTGDNLFTGVGAVAGLLGPEVQITAPQSNLALSVGDSVQVTANVSSPDGVTSVKYSGLFSGGQTAFTEIVVTLPSPQDTTLSRYMKQAGATTGTVRIIVEATDALGDKGADTVNVIIS
ncbi:MAG: Ig-like domain-containing protein [Gemmatimonadales bacterium]